MDTSKILENILLTIRCFINRYQCDDNFLFLSESDIQCSLYADLIKTVNYRIPLLITEKQGIDRVPPAINIIQTEYANKIDIACIDPVESTKLINNKLKEPESIANFLWRLPLLAGIELKYIQYNYSTQQKFGEFLADIVKFEKFLKKIREANEQNDHELPDMKWIALAFLQNDSSLTDSMRLKGEKQGYYYEQVNDTDINVDKDAYIITPKQILMVCKNNEAR